VSRRGWWLFAAMSLIWGVPYLLIKVAVGGVEPPVLVLARVGIGAALLLPLAIRRRELAPLLPHWRWLMLFAVVEIMAPWLFLSEAETRLSSSLSGLLIASVPILVALLSRLTGGRDRLTAVRWAGLLIGLGGVGLLVAGGGAHGDAAAVGEVLLVAVCYSIGPLIAARKLSGLPSLGMTAACLAFAAIVYAPLAALTWPSAVPSGTVLASLAGLAVLCTAAAFVLFFALIAEAGPARASVITYINPAVAVTLGVLVLGERLTVPMAVAFVLILGGSVLATRSGRGARGDVADASASPADTTASRPGASADPAHASAALARAQVAGDYQSAPRGAPD
jgi:drug/metabolite transporter (DMT)-like permease